MTLCHVHIGRGFLCFYNCLYRMRSETSLEKCWETFDKEDFFMSGRSHEEGLKDLTLLGNQGTTYSYDYAPEVLESVDNLHADRDIL